MRDWTKPLRGGMKPAACTVAFADIPFPGSTPLEQGPFPFIDEKA